MNLQASLLAYSKLLLEKGFTEEADVIEKAAHYDSVDTPGVPSFFRRNYDYGEGFYFGDMSKKPGVKDWRAEHEGKGPKFKLTLKKKKAALSGFCKVASPRMETLEENKKPLTDEEREKVLAAGAVWHHGPNGEETPAIWKAEVNGKTWYVCNTHRAYQAKSTLAQAIKSYEFIKTTAASEVIIKEGVWVDREKRVFVDYKTGKKIPYYVSFGPHWRQEVAEEVAKRGFNTQLIGPPLFEDILDKVRTISPAANKAIYGSAVDGAFVYYNVTYGDGRFVPADMIDIRFMTCTEGMGKGGIFDYADVNSQYVKLDMAPYSYAQVMEETRKNRIKKEQEKRQKYEEWKRSTQKSNKPQPKLQPKPESKLEKING